MNPFPPLRGLLKLILILSGLALALVLWHFWLIHFHTPGWEPEFVSTSPDGRHAVSVYHNSGLLIFDNAGTVVLRDTRTGKVLQREVAESVSAGTETPNVTWDSKSNWVAIVSIGAWDLPPEEPAE
jgi:hypothetical protein